MISFLIVMSYILGYSAMAGAVGIVTNGLLSKKHDGRHCDIECGHRWLGGVGGLFWPIAIAVLPAALLAAMFIGEGSKSLTRVDRQRQVEINEAEHRVKLARLKAQEDAILTEQLSETNFYRQKR